MAARNRWLILLFPLALLGCEEKSTGPTGKRVADQLQTIRDDMCACKDEPCSSQVMVRFDSFLASNQFERGDRHAAARVKRLISELESCERRTRLAKMAAVAKAKAKATGASDFPVDRSNPPIGLSKLAARWMTVGSADTGVFALELSFDATINKMMANSHELLVHARCDSLLGPRSDEGAITGEELGGTTVGNTSRASVLIFATRSLTGKPASCTVSFRVAGSPSDFERVCLRDVAITPGQCTDAPETDTPAKNAPAGDGPAKDGPASP